MSHLSDYMKKEQLLKQLQEELLALEESDDLKKDLEFKEQLEMLMKEYEKTGEDVLSIFAPYNLSEQPSSDSASKKPARKVRKLKVYKNPITGEEVHTRGGNQKTLKQWKDEHGDEVVESWLINDDADNQPTPNVTPPLPEDSVEDVEDKQEEDKEQEEEKVEN